MRGTMKRLQQCESKHGGIAYRAQVVCEDNQERVLWIYPNMRNYEMWQDVVSVMQHDRMKHRALVLDGLRVLRKDHTKLNADHRPEFVKDIAISEV